MWHYVVAMALLAHGIGHMLFLANSWGYWKASSGRAGVFAGMPQGTEGAIARQLRWAVDVLSAVALTPSVTRTELTGERITPDYLFSAAELIDHAAALTGQSGLLLQDSEPRWW